ncbi:MAG: class I SAM-dependent methyltransferase, partial [candidate division Zixibacteria bacterium]|nr:class I SAM-dependent methyltransferase [candidate division Zixibacteria bacterium]NIW00595.1 methyltransferase domain-containing protein [Candidatus Saccharibacteria bacterium]
LHLIHKKAYEKASEFTKEKTVLDLGCNTGYGSHILKGACKEIIGVDVSEKAIKIANELYGNDGVEFSVIDGKRLPFKENRFDVVVSFQVIEHIVDQGEYLKEIKRVLVPGGKIIFTTPNRLIRLYPDMKPWNEFHV